ncbi:hypothetical protein CW713_06080 [Methanophagales archaeon]|nr:MAG: hypothetical protein CW713_06080 [Methanophagales archaeon]
MQINESGITKEVEVLKVLKGVELPDISDIKREFEKQKHNVKPTEEDWAFIKSAITDLPADEKDKLINEAKKIFEGNSKLSKEEQEEILQTLGYYILKAQKEQVGVKWWSNVHYDMSRVAGEKLVYVSSAHVDTLGSYASWADQHRDQPPLPGLILNRHSWVIWDFPILGFDNYGPDSCEYFMDHARANFSDYDVSSAYVDIGKGLHYIEDLGCPFHTSAFFGQAHHTDYEEWISNNWNELKSATDVNVYYIIDDPSEDAKILAYISGSYLDDICYIMNNDPNWQQNSTLISITRELIGEAEKFTIGMIVYATKFESPDTVGSNSVPIYDFQTSYAYIDDVACSDSMIVWIDIGHTYIGDLECWLGWKDEPSSTYIEYKCWDRQGGSDDDIVGYIRILNFQNIHDWRLRVRDCAAGDEGEIREFSIYIG